MNQNNIKCPHCNTEINISDALAHDIEDKLIEQLTVKMNNDFKLKLDAEKELAKQQVTLENQKELSILQEKIASQNEMLSKLNNLTIENNELKFNLEQQKQSILIEFQSKFQNQMEDVQNNFKLMLNQKDEQLKTLNSSLMEAQQKASQGSMQLQGEAQETAIESYLSENFIYDDIIEIKKGQRGADCLQVVNNNNSECGKIYYESKRTKEFSPSWIDKFKSDMTEKGADIGVLVTSVYPKGMEQMGFFNGVLICSFTEFKSVVTVLRENLIRISQVMGSQENKGMKIELLYNYLISSEFKMTIENIIGTFSSMKDDLDSEKRSISRIWTKREKQIEIAENNAIKMYGTLQATLGNKLPNIDLLMLENI